MATTPYRSEPAHRQEERERESAWLANIARARRRCRWRVRAVLAGIGAGVVIAAASSIAMAPRGRTKVATAKSAPSPRYAHCPPALKIRDTCVTLLLLEQGGLHDENGCPRFDASSFGMMSCITSGPAPGTDDDLGLVIEGMREM